MVILDDFKKIANKIYGMYDNNDDNLQNLKLLLLLIDIHIYFGRKCAVGNMFGTSV
jgi:hypothetical protein